MALTPLEIQEKTFSSSLFGYDKGEVESFLEEVAETLKDLQRENNQLKDEVARLEKELEKLRTEERLIREAIIKAQELAERLKNQAEEEARLIVEKAQEERKRLLTQAQEEKDKVQQEIELLKQERERLLLELRTALRTWEEFLDQAFGKG